MKRLLMAFLVFCTGLAIHIYGMMSWYETSGRELFLLALFLMVCLPLGILFWQVGERMNPDEIDKEKAE